MNATFLTKRSLSTVKVWLYLQGSEPGPAPPVTMECMDMWMGRLSAFRIEPGYPVYPGSYTGKKKPTTPLFTRTITADDPGADRLRPPRRSGCSQGVNMSGFPGVTETLHRHSPVRVASDDLTRDSRSVQEYPDQT